MKLEAKCKTEKKYCLLFNKVEAIGFFYYEQCIVIQSDYLSGLPSLKLPMQNQTSQSYVIIFVEMISEVLLFWSELLI